MILQHPAKQKRKPSAQQSADGGGGGGDESGSSVEHHEKFRALKLSPSILFFDDLTIHIGIPNSPSFMDAMRSEHEMDGQFCRKTGEVTTSQSYHHMQVVSPKSEWNIVMKDEHLIQDPTPHCLKIPGREVEHNLCYYFKLSSKRFKDVQSSERLLKEEVLALRLWSGPMNTRYAYFFRKIKYSKDQGTSHSKDEKCTAETKCLCPYVTTLHALNSGVMKLARIWKMPLNLKVYRGFKNMGPINIEEPDLFGCSGGVEPCVLATTSSLSNANHYSKGGFKLEIEVGQVNKGADISWLSQFPHECEILFPALSNIEFIPSQCQGFTSGAAVVGCKMEAASCESAEGAAVPVYQVRITSHWKCRTLDEFRAATMIQKHAELQSS